MKVGPASRHVVTLRVKNLCPGIRVRLTTPLVYAIEHPILLTLKMMEKAKEM